MQLTDRHQQFLTTMLGLTLVVTGIVLLLERTRDGLVPRLWPLVLLIVGVAKAGAGAADERDEAWWLIGVGSWFLADTFVTTAVRSAGPLVVVVAGLAAFAQALAQTLRVSSGRQSHVS